MIWLLVSLGQAHNLPENRGWCQWTLPAPDSRRAPIADLICDCESRLLIELAPEDEAQVATFEIVEAFGPPPSLEFALFEVRRYERFGYQPRLPPAGRAVLFLHNRIFANAQHWGPQVYLERGMGNIWGPEYFYRWPPLLLPNPQKEGPDWVLAEWCLQAEGTDHDHWWWGTKGQKVAAYTLSFDEVVALLREHRDLIERVESWSELREYRWCKRKRQHSIEHQLRWFLRAKWLDRDRNIAHLRPQHEAWKAVRDEQRQAERERRRGDPPP